MAEVAGNTNEVWILTGAVAMANNTGAKILGVDNSSFGKLCEILDITAFGDTYKNRLAGIKDTTVSISGNYYASDSTGQEVIVPGDSVYIGVMPSGPTVAGTQVPAIVESYEISSDANGKQTFSATFACKGAPVELAIRI